MALISQPGSEWTPRDAAAQYCLEDSSFQHPDLKLDGNARSVVKFDSVFPEATPDVAYAPVDIDGYVAPRHTDWCVYLCYSSGCETTPPSSA